MERIFNFLLPPFSMYNNKKERKEMTDYNGNPIASEYRRRIIKASLAAAPMILTLPSGAASAVSSLEAKCEEEPPTEYNPDGTVKEPEYTLQGRAITSSCWHSIAPNGGDKNIDFW